MDERQQAQTRPAERCATDPRPQAPRGVPGAAAEAPAAVPAWRLGRNCSLSPRAFIAATCCLPVGLALASIGCIALECAWVTAIAMLQAVGVVAAVLAYMPHANDGDEFVLRDGRLHWTQREGSAVRHREWPVHAVRLIRSDHRRAHWLLLAGGRRYRIGRHAPAARVDAAGADLRRVLSAAASPSA